MLYENIGIKRIIVFKKFILVNSLFLNNYKILFSVSNGAFGKINFK